MATITGLDAARMKLIEAASIVTGVIRGDNLVLTTKGGTEVVAGNVRGPKGDKGDTGAKGTDADLSVARDIVRGSVIDLGDLTGAVNLATANSGAITAITAINANLKARLTGNVTLAAANMPTVTAGTQFTIRFTQDSTGSRTLTLTNIKKPNTGLTLSTAASALDIVVFYYDGTSWYAQFSGKGFA